MERILDDKNNTEDVNTKYISEDKSKASRGVESRRHV